MRVNSKAHNSNCSTFQLADDIEHIHKMNILNKAILMHKVYNEAAPATFF